MGGRRVMDVRGPYIKLAQLIKLAGIAGSGAEASALVRDGGVRLNGDVELRRSRKVIGGDLVEVEGYPATIEVRVDCG
ncbi:MAG: RNA-binding S4 domain-containing protein [Oscillospiraceae bacterium]|nr:RNA-binding S4 domain-containing protein [Oscillospiraceae bacterium]